MNKLIALGLLALTGCTKECISGYKEIGMKVNNNATTIYKSVIVPVGAEVYLNGRELTFSVDDSESPCFWSADTNIIRDFK